eukprot:3383805-Prymnesium_polylepis.3
MARASRCQWGKPGPADTCRNPRPKQDCRRRVTWKRQHENNAYSGVYGWFERNIWARIVAERATTRPQGRRLAQVTSRTVRPKAASSIRGYRAVTRSTGTVSGDNVRGTPHHSLEHCGPDCSTMVLPPTTPAGQA